MIGISALNLSISQSCDDRDFTDYSELERTHMDHWVQLLIWNSVNITVCTVVPNVYLYMFGVWLGNTCGRSFLSAVSVLWATETPCFDVHFLVCINLHVHSCLTTPLGTEAVPSGKTCIWNKLLSRSVSFFCIKYVLFLPLLVNRSCPVNLTVPLDLRIGTTLAVCQFSAMMNLFFKGKEIL